jgi:hypothetical protein
MRNNGAPPLTKVDQLHSVALSSGLTTCTLLSNLGCQRCPAQSGAVCVSVFCCSGARRLKCACLAPEPMWHRAHALSPIAIPDDQTALSTATKLYVLHFVLSKAAVAACKAQYMKQPVPDDADGAASTTRWERSVRVQAAFTCLVMIIHYGVLFVVLLHARDASHL